MRERAAALSSGVSRIEATRSAEAFVRYVMQDETGHSVELDTFTRFYIRAFEVCRQLNWHVTFITPPGLGKSSLARVLLTRHIGMKPSLRTVITSADVGVATNSVTLCREIVMSQPFIDVFPNVKPDYERSKDARGWRMSQWFLRTSGQRNDPTMQAVAAVPKGEAIRVDMLLADDMITEATCEGEVHNRIANSFFKTWVEGRLSNGGWCVYQQNVRRKGDLAHRLIVHPKFTSIWIGLNESCDALFVHVYNPPPGWDSFLRTQDLIEFEPSPVDAIQSENAPERAYSMPLPVRKGWTPERLRMIDTASRLQLYHLNASDPTGLMLPHFLNRRSESTTVRELMELEGQEIGGLPSMTERDRLRYVTVMGIDLGPENREGSMALSVGAKDINGIRYPVEIDSGKWTLTALAERIDQTWRRGIRPSLILVENNSLQEVIIQALRDMEHGGRRFEWRHLVVSFTTGRNKWNPQHGLTSLDVLFEQGVYRWPNGESSRQDFAHADKWMKLETRMSQITKQAARASTPDDIMSFWFMDTAIRRFSPNTTTTGTSPLTGSSMAGYQSADSILDRY